MFLLQDIEKTPDPFYEHVETDQLTLRNDTLRAAKRRYEYISSNRVDRGSFILGILDCR